MSVTPYGAGTAAAALGPATDMDGSEESGLYVLYRAPGAARYPFLAAWVRRHSLSAGVLVEDASRFPRVLVIGPPDGLLLPHTCRVAYVQAEAAEQVFAADPAPRELFPGGMEAPPHA